MVIIPLISIVFFDFIKCKAISSCNFATANKYLGYFDVTHGTVLYTPYKTKDNYNSTICQKECQFDELCYVASLDGNQLCSLYNTTNIKINLVILSTVYIWLRCEWNFAVQPSDGRCRGLFVRYEERSLHVTDKYLILNVSIQDSALPCLNACLDNPVCEAATYVDGNSSCSLHQLWPFVNVKEITQPQTRLYKWSCIPGFVDTLRLYKMPSQPSIEKCTGYWEISSRNATLPNVKQVGVHFHTQSFNVCLSECDLRPACMHALFNVSTTTCILPFTESSGEYDYFENLTFIHFRWICVKNDSMSPPMSDKEEEYVKMRLTCARLITNKDVFIAQDFCDNFPALKTFVRCQERSNTKLWSVTDSCLVNQSFWTFPPKVRSLILNGTIINYEMRIYTGVASFWMLFSKADSFQEVSFLECRRFNGARSNKATLEEDIINRKQWHAFPHLHRFSPFQKTPINIVLTSSRSPYFGCRSKDSCLNILRNLQMLFFKGAGTTKNFNDIPYNFMLDEMGNVYEIRGWKYQSAAVLDFNYNSLTFAFIGCFAKMKPPQRFLDGVKKLIELAVQKQFVSTNYTLYVHQDVAHDFVYRNYEIVIKNWYRYRGFIPNNCSIIALKIIAINVALIFVIIAVLFCLCRWWHRVKYCSKCDFLRSIKFTLIYPKIDWNNDDEFSSIAEYSGNTIRCCITERGQLLFSKKLHKVVKLLRIWYVHKFIRSYSSLHVDSDLGSFLQHSVGYSDKMKVFEAYCSNYSRRMEDNLYVVLCLTNQASLVRFQNLLANEICICQYFSLAFLSFAYPTFEIV